jgi:sugar fermentation stimulation protein A
LNNTGRLYQFLVKGREGFCLRNEKVGKTTHRLFSVKEGELGAIVDTRLQMQAFEKSVERGVIPWLKGYRIVKRNARLGSSLIDYLLECDSRSVYLEVKSAVLREGNYAMYPDSPSPRGRRHVKELINHVMRSGEAIILFIAALPGVTAFKPDRAADPKLCQLLSEARLVGVKIKAIGMAYHPGDSSVHLFDSDLNVDLL